MSVNILNNDRVKKIHCLGIGGVGVCGIAELLLAHGYKVSGSDAKKNANTERLIKEGADVFIGHDAANLSDADALVYSSAVADENPEWQLAVKKGLPILRRAEMLAALMNLEKGIAISGTHGKTTTSSLVSHVLLHAGLEPSFAIGGELKGVNQYARLGSGHYFVAEADESDASFLHLSPLMAVVTNIDADHMSTYDDDFETLKQTFVTFLAQLPHDGTAFLCIDDPHVSALCAGVEAAVVTFGFDRRADVHATEFKQEGLQSFFTVNSARYVNLNICLNLPGQHNVQNALAAIAIADKLGIDAVSLQDALRSFHGVGRRFHIYGDIAAKNGTALLVDDYGHHPCAINATLKAARQAWPDRRLVLAFQPHRYTRTRDLLMDFAQALACADVLLLLEVYSAGEEAIANADGQALCECVSEQGKVIPIFVPNIGVLPDMLKGVLEAGDILLLQGAGSIGALAKELVG
jgi:UDP-N-acetylmuramate--alanine ligase